MTAQFMSPWLLAPLFGGVALLYSSVGLAGGSSYIALLTIFGLDYQLIPSVALSMNIMVSTLGAWNFFRGHHTRARLILPFLISSTPMAWFGGTIHLSSQFFHILLLIFLSIVALRIYLFSNFRAMAKPGPAAALLLSLTIGAVLGFISGALGLGGGIYLIPLIIIFGLGSQKEAAACGTIFIWVNSVAGLAARLTTQAMPPIHLLAPLLFAVTIGGYFGSFLGAYRISPKTMQRLLGLIVVIAIIFLLPKCF